METRPRRLGAWRLAAAAAAMLAVATPALEARSAGDEQRARLRWRAPAANRMRTRNGDGEDVALRRLVDLGLRRHFEPRPSPFAAGWKRRYSDGGAGSARDSRESIWSRRLFGGSSGDDDERARYTFQSWGGQRPSPTTGWGGGKRTQRFFSWGGKRSLAEDELKRMMATVGLVQAPVRSLPVDLRWLLPSNEDPGTAYGPWKGDAAGSQLRFA